MQATHHYDVVILGAGPAGLCLASQLRNSGLSILLIDKKKCAEDVQYHTLASFIDPQRWGLPDDLRNPIRENRFFSEHASARHAVRVSVIDRGKLLAFLEKQAKANPALTLHYNSMATGVACKGSTIQSIIYYKNRRERKEATAKVFADCSGLTGLLCKQAGIYPRQPIQAVGAEYIVPLKSEPHTTDLFVGKRFQGGYGWIFPLNEKEAIIGYGTLDARDFKNAAVRLREMWSLPRVAERCVLRPLKESAAVLITGMPQQQLNAGNLICIGDCVLQANPLVGEGVRFVMDAAAMAAPWIENAIKHNELPLLSNYSQKWRKRYENKYRIAFRLQQRFMQVSSDDARVDQIVRKMHMLSDVDMERIMSGELNRTFLTRLGIKLMVKNTLARLGSS
ncbi:MAG: digeranylgeranylglycerophospholipid reductase [Chitinophagales bacterium]|nr:MAG: digeranylgeranylglycerophospholipid reductase [Chitinophagales bacterium]